MTRAEFLEVIVLGKFSEVAITAAHNTATAVVRSAWRVSNRTCKLVNEWDSRIVMMSMPHRHEPASLMIAHAAA